MPFCSQSGLLQDGCGRADGLVLYNYFSPIAIAELGNSVCCTGYGVYDRHDDRLTMLLYNTVECCQVNIRAHAKMWVVKSTKEIEVLAARPCLQINVTHSSPHSLPKAYAFTVSAHPKL